jgi:antitoxin CcdA
MKEGLATMSTFGRPRLAWHAGGARLTRITIAERSGIRPTNVSLRAALVDEAKALDVNISQAASQGVEKAVKRARVERWLAENTAALDSYNEWVETNGLPLEKHRLF